MIDDYPAHDAHLLPPLKSDAPPPGLPGWGHPAWSATKLISALGAFSLTLITALQPLLLDELMPVPFELAGTINAQIVVLAQAVTLAGLTLVGERQNRYPRTAMISMGLLAAFGGTVLTPFADSVDLILGFGGLIVLFLLRVPIMLGIETAQMQIALLEGRRKRPGDHDGVYAGRLMMMVIGGVVIGGVIMQVPNTGAPIEAVLMIPALALLAAAFIAMRMLRFRVQEPYVDLSGRFGRIWEVVSEEPRLQLGMAAAFFVRADLALMALFLSLWSSSYADLGGIPRTHAIAHAGLLLGWLGLMTLIAMPFWRMALTRSPRIAMIGAALSLMAVGNLLLGFIAHPFEWRILLPLAMIGVGQAGAIMAPEVLTAKLVPQELHGQARGLFQLIGGAGVILMLQSGGRHFDAVGPTAPFLLIGSGLILITLYAFWLIAHHERHTIRRAPLRPLILLVAMLPLIWLIGRAMISGYAPGAALNQMPVAFITRGLGDWAIIFMVLSLALRPAREITGINHLSRYARIIGLYAFFYAGLHVLSYAGLERLLNWGDVLRDMGQRPFILFGVAGFMMLTVLALSSSRRIARHWKIKGRDWKRIHRTVYVINILLVIHYLMAAEPENGEPWLFAVVVAGLLYYRLRAGWRRRQVQRGY
ncbi:MAG: ferric reductase-like transmembrane domain-containing protein [Magnetococcales bacterium]|nr:ferric reductase-like transmembrane domain-containing protein [Magnetococcales bacterium]